MSVQLMQTLQKLAKETIDASHPADYLIGVVESESPLSIRVEQKDIISEEFLILTDAVRDYEVDIEVNHVTENRGGGSGDASYESHNHGYVGRKRIKVFNGLHAGEAVILLRQSGGQEYCVLSRIADHENLSGKWG